VNANNGTEAALELEDDDDEGYAQVAFGAITTTPTLNGVPFPMLFEGVTVYKVDAARAVVVPDILPVVESMVNPAAKGVLMPKEVGTNVHPFTTLVVIVWPTVADMKLVVYEQPEINGSLTAIETVNTGPNPPEFDGVTE
jgi:hypothetical protein